MSEPRRLLLDPDAADFEHELLRAWGDEQPSRAARDRAMGLVAIAGAGAVGAHAVGALAPNAAATSVAAAVKWSTLGVILIGGATAGVSYVARDRHPDVGAETGTATPIRTQIAVPTANARATAEEIQSPPSPSPRSARTPRADMLAEQIAMMDGVRAAIASGGGAHAVRLVDDYERRFPRGAFLEEAEALRVDAIAKTANFAATRHAADRFLVAHPSSPHAARIRTLSSAATP
ncbi:MAG TPA: hypothetical protein VIF62_14645 [Labilithrix sp.]